MISKEKFLEAAKTCLEDRIAEFAWNDHDWQKYLKVEEEDRLYSDFEDYISRNYIIHDFPDGSVVVKDLFGFEMR